MTDKDNANMTRGGRDVARDERVTVEHGTAGAIERIDPAAQRSESAAKCIRCDRAAPNSTSAEFLQWDPVGDSADSLICPDCLTYDEETAAGQKPVLADVDLSQRHGQL
jgi:hypothetical protein